jgi:GT2 family glycosyltransferase/glycosyltransferase involved in cell wall biosynthesis
MRVLLVVHGLPPQATGGTEVYTWDLARALVEWFGDDVVVLAREADETRDDYAERRERRDGIDIVWVNNTFRACRSYRESYRQPRIAAVGAALADEIRPDVVHVQHLTGLSTALVALLTARRLPVVVTLNDYWLLCHRGQLLDRDHQRCEGPSVAGCARCLGEAAVPGAVGWMAPVWRVVRSRLPDAWATRIERVVRRGVSAASPMCAGDAAAERLADMAAIVPHVAQFLAPSRTLAEAFRRFGIPEDRLLLQEQGIDRTRFAAVRRAPGDRLRLGFLGSLMVSKAPHVLLEAVAPLSPRAVQVDLYGAIVPYHGDDTYRRRLEPLLTLPHVRYHGPIDHEAVPAALAAVDVLVVPSIWIENAPFVIKEAFAAGVPVVASRLGGMAELVADERSGLLVEPGSPEALRAAIRRLLEEPGLLDRLRGGVPRVKPIEEDAAWTREVYARHVAHPHRTFFGRVGGNVAPTGGEGPRLAVVVLNYRTPVETWLAARALGESTRRPDLLLVVDNHSGDGSARWLRERLPAARLVETASNLGFGGGVNAGVRMALEAGADLVAIANSDVVAARDALARLAAALDVRPDIGVVGPLVLSRADPTRVASCGLLYDARTGRMRHRHAGVLLADLRLPPVLTVDGVSGCLMLVRRAVFERVGLFDEPFFFSFEDLDLCLRAAAAGFRSACVTAAVAYHEGSLTIGRRSPVRLYYAMRNHLALAARHGSRAMPARLLRGASVVGLNLGYALAASEAPRLAALRAAVRGAIHYLRGRDGAAA